MVIYYVYPIWHRVSFSLIAREHIKQLKRYLKVYEIDELVLPTITPYTRPLLVLHPYFYMAVKYAKRFERILTKSRGIIGVDVADSDRLTIQAVNMTHYTEAMIVPSNFARDAYIKSGVKRPVYVVPHGLSERYYSGRRTINFFRKLWEMKRSRNLKYLLFFCWHCFDEQTRVLTKDGFKYYQELSSDDEIATVNPRTFELEYQKPLKIWVHDYDGIMIHFNGQHYDLLVTPNHRLLVGEDISYYESGKHKFRREWKIIEAIELYNEINKRSIGWKHHFKRNVVWKGRKIETYKLPKVELSEKYPKHVLKVVSNKPRILNEVPIRPLLKLLAWFISEGCLQYAIHNQSYMVRIATSNPEYANEIVNLARELGYGASVIKNKNGKIRAVTISSKQLFTWLRSLGFKANIDFRGKKAYIKFIPQFIKELSSDLIEEFILTLWKGDGTFYKTKNGKLVPMKYTTTSRKLAEDVAELILKIGYGASINIDMGGNKEHPLYNVIIVRRYVEPRVLKKPGIVYYRGKVWCVTVPNGLIIVERNGKIVIAGNSPERKGLDLVLKTYRLVREERKDIVLIMKLMTLDPRIHKIVAPLGGIILHGWLTEDQKLELYDHCDIYLGFSRGGGFELNYLEALARGEIVIAPNRGSWVDYLPEFSLVDHHNCPYVLKDNPIHCGRGVEIDVDKAVKKILDIADNLDEYKARVKEYVETKIRKEYTWERVGLKLKNILEKYI